MLPGDRDRDLGLGEVLGGTIKGKLILDVAASR
jgi:hypothetical protein